MNKVIFVKKTKEGNQILYTQKTKETIMKKELKHHIDAEDVIVFAEGRLHASFLPAGIKEKAKTMLCTNPFVFIYKKGCVFQLLKEKLSVEDEIRKHLCYLGQYSRKDIFGNDLEKEWLTFAKDLPYINESVKKVTVNNGHIHAKRIAI